MTRLGALLMILLVGSCNADDEKVFSDNSNIEVKPVASLLPAGAANATGLTQTAKPAANASFQITINSRSGAELCTGEINLQIMSDLNLKFPDFKLKCLSATIDLGKALSAGGGGLGGGSGGEDPAEAAKNIEHDGKMLRLKKIGGMIFEPARPVVIGPLIGNAEKYKDFQSKTNHSVSGSDLQTGEAYSGSGSIEVEVYDHKTKYSNDYIDETFKNVIHWEIRANGFESLPAAKGLLFKKMEWYWSTSPLMIPKLIVVAKLTDFVAPDPSAGDAKLAEALLGELTVTLEVKDYESL